MPHRPGGPVPTASRSGRELQKYGPDGERLVAGSIPVRFKPGVAGPEGVEVLLISSRKGKGHVFPKGGWECDEELRDAAARETVEEAGVRGELEEPIIGKFPFHSGKAERLHTAHGGRCVAYLFVMHVAEVLPEWPEAGQRSREWCSLQAACARCRYDWMREALVTWMRRRGWDAEADACLACSRSGGGASAASSPAVQAPAAGPEPCLSPSLSPSPSTSPPACAAVMATGGAAGEVMPAEAAVPAAVDRIAIRT